MHLFANLPSTGRITASHTSTCCELSRYWQFYVAKSRSLQKVFVSIKGVYFQAEIMGEPINWLVPHKFTQSLPKEVDIRVMLTFLEFYEVFLKFVLFKLFTTQDMQYPPKIDSRLDDAGCCLLAVKAASLAADGNSDPNLVEKAVTSEKKEKPRGADEATTAKAKEALATLPQLLESLKEEEKEEEDEELGLLPAPLEAALFGGPDGGNIYGKDADDEVEFLLILVVLVHNTVESFSFFGNQVDENERVKTFALTDGASNRGRLFAGLCFFINREVPLDWFQLCIVAFGGKVGWESELSPFEVTDERITHQVVDRPIQGVQSKSREYIQPQWVLDSINANVLLPVQNYLPGAKLPPHLSPFVDDEKEGYLPRYREELRRLGAVVVGNAAADKNSKATGKDVAKEELEEDEEEAEDGDSEEEDNGAEFEEDFDGEDEDEGEGDEKEAPKKAIKNSAAQKKKTAKQIEVLYSIRLYSYASLFSLE